MKPGDHGAIRTREAAAHRHGQHPGSNGQANAQRGGVAQPMSSAAGEEDPGAALDLPEIVDALQREARYRPEGVDVA